MHKIKMSLNIAAVKVGGPKPTFATEHVTHPQQQEVKLNNRAKTSQTGAHDEGQGLDSDENAKNVLLYTLDIRRYWRGKN